LRSCCIMFDVLHSRAQQTMTTTRARPVSIATTVALQQPLHCSNHCIVLNVLRSWVLRKMVTTRARQVGVAFPACCILADVLHTWVLRKMVTTMRARQVGVAFPARCILAEVWHSWVPRKMGIRPARSVACLLMLPVCPFATCHWLKGRRSEACLCVVAPCRHHWRLIARRFLDNLNAT